MTQYKLVQMKLLPDTLARVEGLRRKLEVTNRTDAIRLAIGIAELVVNAISEGRDVVLQSKDGSTREVLRVPGVSRAG